MLPSQFGRPKSSRSHMYRKPRRRRLPIVLGLLTTLIAVAVVFKWWPGSPDLAPADAAVADPAMQQASIALPKTQDAAPPVKPQLTPQGGPARSEAPANPAPVNASASPAANLPQPPSEAVEKVRMGGNNATSSSAQSPAVPKGAPTLAAPVKTGLEGLQPKANAPTAPNSSNTNSSAAGSSARSSQRVQVALELIAQNKPVEARKLLSAALESLSAAEADRVRQELTKLNQRLVFSPEVVVGDPFAGTYIVQSGDALAKLPKKLGLSAEYLFLKRINGIDNERRIRVGQKLKFIRGPFHAVVDKRAFRMDIYLGQGDERVFVCSLKVGLGEHDATPEGVFEVKADSKLINPAWANPRTGEQFAAEDPKNPLGEYWIGLVGVSENIRGLEGYGIHGTIEPESIGQMKSMGCVRLLHDDVALVYELLTHPESRVTIVGSDYP